MLGYSTMRTSDEEELLDQAFDDFYGDEYFEFFNRPGSYVPPLFHIEEFLEENCQ